MKKALLRFVREEEGQDLVEYAMLIALIALICVAGVGTLGTAVDGFYAGIAADIPLIGAGAGS
jgi:pilus assembly protein Flp/PilA